MNDKQECEVESNDIHFIFSTALCQNMKASNDKRFDS